MADLRLVAFGVLVACAVGACRADQPIASTSERDASTSSPPPPQSSPDAGAKDEPRGGAPSPWRDASVLPLPSFSGELCVLHVGARCDGPEDCPGGQTCCAQFEALSYGYRSIQCQDSCDAVDQFELCHPGQVCDDPSQVCRRSVLVPHDFITVCADAAPVPTDTTSAAIDDEVLCGESSCRAGSEQCCLRATFDFATMMSTALPPYCAPLSSGCQCDDQPVILDASVEDGG